MTLKKIKSYANTETDFGQKLKFPLMYQGGFLNFKSASGLQKVITSDSVRDLNVLATKARDTKTKSPP